MPKIFYNIYRVWYNNFNNIDNHLKGTNIMKTIHRLGKYTVDFTEDLLLTKNADTELTPDLLNIEFINIVYQPISKFKERLATSYKVLKFIWSK